MERPAKGNKSRRRSLGAGGRREPAPLSARYTSPWFCHLRWIVLNCLSKLETASSDVTERGATRMDDQASEAAMEQRKKQGYF